MFPTSICLVLSLLAGEYFVTADRLNVRLRPNISGAITNRLDRGQKVDVFEVRNGWARISKYYDGFLEGEKGNVARWVFSKHLSKKKPLRKKPLVPNKTYSPALIEALNSSDDYFKYSNKFLKASKLLIDKGLCSTEDFKEFGGWMRSTSRREGTYFVYCGQLRKSNKVYFNVKTGELFK